MYDESGKPVTMTYAAGIQGIRSISSDDMVNWTDHGVINVHGPASTNPLITNPPIGGTYASATWAPSAAWKTISGRDRFFIYYANSGNGIGVIVADSPTGPWRSPLTKLLIDRDTPNCRSVSYLFDPGVLVDDDGSAYLFFGGGGSGELTGQGRWVELGPDMISLKNNPVLFDPPFLFEASDITKINGNY
jgi:arabinoxylan arabinofuranohydrolase